MTDILTVAGDLLSALLQLVTLGATGVAVVAHVRAKSDFSWLGPLAPRLVPVIDRVAGNYGLAVNALELARAYQAGGSAALVGQLLAEPAPDQPSPESRPAENRP